MEGRIENPPPPMKRKWKALSIGLSMIIGGF